MASNIQFSQSIFDEGLHHDHRHSTAQAPTDRSFDGYNVRTSTEVDDDHTIQSPRNGSVATAFTQGDAVLSATPTNNVDTIADPAPATSTADTRKMSASTNRKIYMHQRHQKGLEKWFTPSNAFDHLPFHHHHKQKHSNNERQAPPSTVSVSHNLFVMLTTFPYWNMAFWSGWCYSIGSALFIVSSCFSWVPIAYPDVEEESLETYGSPVCFFLGACLYQIGGVMAYLEAVNDGSFAGAAMKRLLEGHQDIEKELLDAKLHTFFGHLIPHHHHEDEDEDRKDSSADATKWESVTKGDSRPEEVYEEAKERVERRQGVDYGDAPTKGKVREYLSWRWWPTRQSLLHYHIFEMGYVACSIQLFGVTLYGVTSIVILPGILTSLAWWQALAAYWIPQMIGSCCFIIASVMFTVMAQERWYKLKVNEVSWWIGLLALIGSCGFLLIAIFGIIGHYHEWANYHSSLSSIWGSFFYMLSGLSQWYEAINDNVGPVLAFPNQRTPAMMRENKSVRNLDLGNDTEK